VESALVVVSDEVVAAVAPAVLDVASVDAAWL